VANLYTILLVASSAAT